MLRINGRLRRPTFKRDGARAERSEKRVERVEGVERNGRRHAAPDFR